MIWGDCCFFEAEMRHTAQPMDRRRRPRLYAATAILSLVLWLFMAVAEAHTPLHAWLHGGAIPHGDACAVVTIAHGKVDAIGGDVPAPVPTTWIESASRVEVCVFAPCIENLPAGRAPPVLPLVS
jgi:hypothetical protein